MLQPLLKTCFRFINLALDELYQNSDLTQASCQTPSKHHHLIPLIFVCNSVRIGKLSAPVVLFHGTRCQHILGSLSSCQFFIVCHYAKIQTRAPCKGNLGKSWMLDWCCDVTFCIYTLKVQMFPEVHICFIVQCNVPRTILMRRVCNLLIFCLACGRV